MTNLHSRAAVRDMTLHALNPRRTEPEASEIEALAASIRSLGLMQGLIVIDEPGSEKLGVIGGGRRFRALRLLIERGELPEDHEVPVTFYKDTVLARAAAVAENAARKNLGPVDEMRAYKELMDHGAPVETVASAFAVTPRYVRQRLALADLPEPVIEAVAAGETDLGMAATLTMAPDHETALDVWRRAMNVGHARRMLNAANADHTMARKIERMGGPEGYTALGGKVELDLFSASCAVLDGTETFEAIYRTWEDEQFAGWAEANGWARWTASGGPIWEWLSLHAETVSLLTEGEAAEMDALTEKAEALDGELEDEELARWHALHDRSEAQVWSDAAKAIGTAVIGWEGDDVALLRVRLDPAHEAEAVEAGLIRTTRGSGKAPATTIDPETGEVIEVPGDPWEGVAAALATDTRQIPADVARVALLKKPTLALDLLTYVIASATPYGMQGLSVRADDPGNSAGLVDISACDPEERYEGGFEDFLEVPKKDRTAILTGFIARALTVSGAQIVLDQIEKGVRDFWAPDEAWLKRLKREQLVAIYEEASGRSFIADYPGQMKKGELVTLMAGLFTGSVPALKPSFAAWLPPQIRPEGWAPVLHVPEQEAA